MNILMLMETFSVVVETGSFTAAAEKLGLSKSFVSKQVSLLEQDLGARLLYRTTRKLSLSEEGSQFYNHCQLIMQEAESARAELLDSHSSPKGKIRMTLPQSLIISGLGVILIRFQQRYPDIELEVIASGRVEDLVESGIDIAIRVGQLEDSSLMSKRLADCRFQVVAAPQYIERFGEPAQPADLLNHNCLIYGDSKVNKGWPFRSFSGEVLTVKTKGNLISNDGHLIVESMLNSLGIGFGPDFLFARYVAEGKLKPLLEEYSSPPTMISALYPMNRNLPRRVRILIDYLADHLDGSNGE
ncbi:LysR family transcriptional regulator [Bacterioplanoides sp. SCSIO 12839]|uniref:LysR family transcriptional regulator n=1 Tax=Bacterioplanoides sp. SCSIO 12839 TaxID=2829569 RepID=UPI002102446F|nr:LysR family transcriptional regulator [Bacterioplanoides sp. SCSIO 12839]UTW47681.1 LysR family transcriptional regulator [Bacterioplanoides sp. SCSIO 12839]